MIIDRSFYLRDTVHVAHDLLGAIVVRTIGDIILSGVITETEAYCFTDDPASHAYRGQTNRNAPMFGQVGCAYVYFIYGNHFCFNIVAKSNDVLAGAVLIRAIQPVEGIEHMYQHRGTNNMHILTNGPGKLTQALCINKQDNCTDLTAQGDLYVTLGTQPKTIEVTSRIGISSAQDKLWRFVGTL